MNLLICLIGLSLIVAPGLAQRRIRQARQCYTPENNIGQCYALSYCPAIANVLNVYPRNVATQYLRAAQRSCGNVNYRGDPVVCCDVNNQQQFTTAPPISNPNNPFFPTNTPTQPVTEKIIQPRPQPTTPPPPPPPPPPTTTTTTTTTTTPAPITAAPTQGGRKCESPDLEPGICIPLAQCPKLINRLRANPSDATFVQYLRTSNKFCNNEYSVVCCPSESQRQLSQEPGIFPRNTDEIPTKLLTKADGCGFSNTLFRKIVGGTASKMGAWPWIALIGYDDGFSESPFKCGGALITSRHVITAAHCIRADLKFVRLGEHDLNRDDEAQHVDVPVVKMLRHPNYSRTNGRNDIALLYLGQNVQFSENITPICIPFEPTVRSMDVVGYTPFVAGWGRTMEGGKSATILQELQLPVITNEECKADYKKANKFISDEQFDNAVLCAGEKVGGKDTCQGDSGGPLMLPESFNRTYRFNLIGVVSYGVGCARPEIPGVYTRVTNFIEWIENGVADTP